MHGNYAMCFWWHRHNKHEDHKVQNIPYTHKFSSKCPLSHDGKAYSSTHKKIEKPYAFTYLP